MLRQARKSILVLIVGLIAASVLPAADHTLLIDEDLRANANVLKVRMDVDDDEIWPFLIGEFEVTEKKGGRSERVTGPLFGSVAHLRAKQKFSLTVQGKGPLTARVKAARNVRRDVYGDPFITVVLPNDVGVDVYLDDEEPKAGVQDNLVAFISFDDEPATSWMLLLQVVRAKTGVREWSHTSLLTDGTRDIVVTAVTTGTTGVESILDARGYQFSEEGRALGAVQYYWGRLNQGGGLPGLFSNAVHLRKDLDPRTRLLLVAAMATILDVKMNVSSDDLGE